MESKLLLDDGEITRTLERLAYQILEKHEKCENIMLVGIERRGADLARRLQKILSSTVNHEVALGTLDINLYRDDWTSMDASPRVGQSNIPQDVTGVAVILIDDVLYTGRTIRSALEAILDYGRPSSVELLVLIDRGHRELPIQADYVGRTINTSREEHVDVLLEERSAHFPRLIRGKNRFVSAGSTIAVGFFCIHWSEPAGTGEMCALGRTHSPHIAEAVF